MQLGFNLGVFMEGNCFLRQPLTCAAVVQCILQLMWSSMLRVWDTFKKGQLFKQSLAFVYQNYVPNYLLSEHLFLWTVLRRLNPNSGRTFTLLNQSFYREYLKAIFCTTMWLPNIRLGQQQQLFWCQWILKWIGLIWFTHEKHDTWPLTKCLVFLSNPNHGLG